MDVLNNKNLMSKKGTTVQNVFQGLWNRFPFWKWASNPSLKWINFEKCLTNGPKQQEGHDGLYHSSVFKWTYERKSHIKYWRSWILDKKDFQKIIFYIYKTPGFKRCCLNDGSSNDRKFWGSSLLVFWLQPWKWSST